MVVKRGVCGEVQYRWCVGERACGGTDDVLAKSKIHEFGDSCVLIRATIRLSSDR